MTLLLVSIGGGVGCVVRYLFEYVVRRSHPTSRPWATVAANALGTGNRRLRGLSAVANWRCEYSSDYFDWILRGLTTFSSALAVPVILQRRTPLGLRRGTYHTTPLVCSGMFVLGMSLPLIRLSREATPPALVVPSNVRVHVGASNAFE